MTPLSAVIITLDEERNLPGALASVAFCDEVVVLDGGSRDRTREVAAAAGARVEKGEPWPGFVEQRNRAVAAARHDWVLAIDADERVTAELRAEIQAEAARGFAHCGYRIPRLAYYLGRWIRGTDWWPDPQLRLFDRRQGRWEGGLVHESVRVEGSVGRLRARMEHFSYDDISDHLSTIDRYTTLWAEQAAQEGRKSGGPLEPAAAALWAFLRNYVIRRGVLLGEAGLTVSALNSYYTYVKLAKLRERLDGSPARPPGK
ncbi:MAG TPA: glycosyltransferase family 2 protein [Vicinamibacteria bacterium]|nr:glycosyltransferase family 2 protein [Vicinamibacteria bacterium]